MRFSSSALLFASSVAGLGINCRGSGFCSLSPNGSIQKIKEQIGVIIADGQGDRHFDTGAQIACTNADQGSFCAFYQSNGASGSANDAFTHIQWIIDHGCKLCGSVPIHDGNNVDDGQLTVNYVSDPCCEGTCHC
ncbi:killer toxin, Kp4/SMK-like, core [Fusarium austroafricanum]|uniref:Killer toxin, Kp4/SMK-like, core n=1 Tax=Fusarium austroafricanum TaxID=2364996 RepID=A0A8H4NRY6_9HYPO|nr:killer toxin, Kp4/SMK-like, core [Fusarium austroafricanum]